MKHTTAPQTHCYTTLSVCLSACIYLSIYLLNIYFFTKLRYEIWWFTFYGPPCTAEFTIIPQSEMCENNNYSAIGAKMAAFARPGLLYGP